MPSPGGTASGFWAGGVVGDWQWIGLSLMYGRETCVVQLGRQPESVFRVTRTRTALGG